jgi:glycerate 2-kinase
LLEGCPIVRTVTPPTPLLIVADAFTPRLSAVAVARAIARGVEDGGLPEADLCPLAVSEEGGEDVRALLDGLDFDIRMRRSRAVVIAAKRLAENTLAGSVTFELATRARQSGVPAYAVTAENLLNAFDARILDLQLILEARGPAALAAAGRKLAGVV